jgi:hypothetical protein
VYVPFASGSGSGSSAPPPLYKFDGTNWTRHGAVRPHVDHNLAAPSHRHGMAWNMRGMEQPILRRRTWASTATRIVTAVSRIGADTSIYGRVFMPGRGLDYNY